MTKEYIVYKEKRTQNNCLYQELLVEAQWQVEQPLSVSVLVIKAQKF